MTESLAALSVLDVSFTHVDTFFSSTQAPGTIETSAPLSAKHSSLNLGIVPNLKSRDIEGNSNLFRNGM